MGPISNLFVAMLADNWKLLMSFCRFLSVNQLDTAKRETMGGSLRGNHPLNFVFDRDYSFVLFRAAGGLK